MGQRGEMDRVLTKRVGWGSKGDGDIGGEYGELHSRRRSQIYVEFPDHGKSCLGYPRPVELAVPSACLGATQIRYYTLFLLSPSSRIAVCSGEAFNESHMPECYPRHSTPAVEGKAAIEEHNVCLSSGT
jgi:hypothetical protein